MALQGTDKLIVGRGSESYQVKVSDTGLAFTDGSVSIVDVSMTGKLTFNTTQTEFSLDPADATAKIIFENTRGSYYNPITVQLFQPGDDKSLVLDGTLRTKGDMLVEGRIYNWDTESEYGNKPTVSTRNAFIDLAVWPEKASLGFTNHTDTSCLEWDLYNGVSIPLPGSGGNTYGFRIAGRIGDHYSDTAHTSTSNLLYTYHNSQETDEIQYFGRIIHPKSLATKEYVDDTVEAAAGGALDVDELKGILEDALNPEPINYDVTDPPTNLSFNQNSTLGYYGVTSSGNITSSYTSYGIWMSDRMLKNFVTDVPIDDWVDMWTGGGKIILNGKYTGNETTRDLTDVSRYTYSGAEGVKFRWSGNTIDVETYMKYFKTEDAFVGESPFPDLGAPVSEVETSWIGQGNTRVTATQPARLNSSGNLSTYSSHAGTFFPWAFLKSLHPNAKGFKVNLDGASVYNRPNDTVIKLATMDGVEGVKVYQTYTTTSNTGISHKFKGVYVEVDYDHTF